jgi:hypothetical protein
MDRRTSKVFILTTPSLKLQKTRWGAGDALSDSPSILITKQAVRKLAWVDDIIHPVSTDLANKALIKR